MDKNFRTIADRKSRGLCGHSMGGNGALKLGMLFADTFSAVYALSPAVLNWYGDFTLRSGGFKKISELNSEEAIIKALNESDQTGDFNAFFAAACSVRIILIYDCKPCRISLFILAVIWFFCTAAAWWAVKNKNIKAHRQFMTRSYTAALAFVFIRIFPLLGYKNIFPFLDSQLDRRTAAEWLCWVVPFLIIEMYMIWWPSLAKHKKGNVP
jgi:hypothetical protein